MNVLTFCLVTALSGPLAAPAAEKDEPAPAEKVKDPVTNASPEAAKKLIDDSAAKKDGKVVVLDIRTPGEFAAGHIPGAVNIDFLSKDYAEKLGKLDREKTYVMHCQSGGRSTGSLETFRKLGFKSIVHLDKGFAGWKKAGQPVEKGK